MVEPQSSLDADRCGTQPHGTNPPFQTGVMRYALIVTLLRQIEVEIANGKMTPQACKEAQITVQTYYRWRKTVRRPKTGPGEASQRTGTGNGKLKRLVAELSLEKQILKDGLREASKPRATQGAVEHACRK